MSTMQQLADDRAVVQRILDHIENKTTDLSDAPWREPVANYRCTRRFAAERDKVLRRYAIGFCPSAALAKTGSWIARDAAGVPILAVRGSDGKVRAFRNACRHRGTQLASGSGCEMSFVCRYHGWTYALDGSLRHVPHEHGFPGLDKASRGLVPVEATEAQGIVFVRQDGPAIGDAEIDSLPPLLPPDYRCAGSAELELPVNWKVFAEGFLEGYHIRSTHTDTFFPVQFDNLNVVESFGRNNRITFPFRAVHRARKETPAERSADGRLTYLYNLFPNVMVATFPGRIIMVVLEPLAVDRTLLVTYQLTNIPASDDAQSALEAGGNLIQAGAAEDRDMAMAIQRSLASGANEFLEFGLFEGAIAHFHRELHAALDAAGGIG